MLTPAYQKIHSRYSEYTSTGRLGNTNVKPRFQLNVTSGDPSMGEAYVVQLPNVHAMSDVEDPLPDRGVSVSGETYRATAKPFSGYRFVKWETNLGSIDTSSNPVDFVLRGDTRLVARFAKAPAVIKMNAVRVGWNGKMGRVNGEGLVLGNESPANSGVVTVAKGNTVKLTASSLDGYHFVKWHGAPVDGKTSATVTFTVDADYAITAEFASNTPGGGGGGIDPDKPVDPVSPVVVGKEETLSKVTAFVKKWWWALAIAAWVCYEEMKGGGK